MTAANLLPLAPKALMSSSSNKPSSALVRPESLISLYPEALVRASIADTLMHRQNLAQSLQVQVNPLLQGTMSYVNYQKQNQEQQLQQRLQQARQRLRLQLQTLQASPAAPKTQEEIIGMGISVPNAQQTPSAVAPRPSSKTPRPKQRPKEQPHEAVQRMRMFGNPLRAPPPLAKRIYKKRAAPATMDQSAKRPKTMEAPPPRLVTPLSPPKALSSDELEFLQAAQSLHEIQGFGLSPLSSTMSKAPLTSRAMKPPPSLGL